MMDYSAEIQKINEDIRRLEELKKNGSLPEDLAEISIDALKIKYQTYLTEVQGDGIIAQGSNAKVVGKDAVLFEGEMRESVFVKGNISEINIGVLPHAKKESLREAYLNYILKQVSPLALSGVVRQSASNAELRLNLSAIYTALLTQASSTDFEAHSESLFGLNLSTKEKGERLERRLSVVEQINKHSHMVLLGDPGSGKSTFINFLAMCMAGEALGRSDVNIKALTQPLPQEYGMSRIRNPIQGPDTQHWDYGVLIPVRIVLRDFAARGLPSKKEIDSAESIWDFIESEMSASSLSEFAPLLKKEIRENGGLVLFDGLDEVPESDNRRKQICTAIESFVAAFPRCRYLVTSRTYAYQNQDWKLKDFNEVILVPFTKEQIAIFVDRWYAHITQFRNQSTKDGKGKADVLKHAIFSSSRLMSLAERPLLLTLMASIHAWRGGTLPDKRQELYADAVDLLLDWWESQRVVRDVGGETSLIQPSLAEWLKVDRKKMRAFLNRIAFEAHIGQSELTGTADISENDLISGLMNLSQNPDVKPMRLIEYLRDRAGLLIPRGVGVYTFLHRTFQEYLAACYLTDHEYPDLIASLVRTEPNRWREVTLLAGAKAAEGTAVFALWSLVDSLSPEREDPLDAARHWGAQIAGQAVTEIAELEKVSTSTQTKIDRLRMRLLDIVEGTSLPLEERVQAGINLSTLGDQRFNPSLWYLPDDEMLGFVLVPAGSFLMGSDEKDKMALDREKPQHEIALPDFWMAKYPVTVAQFRMFVELSNYSFDNWDLNQISSNPIISVNWYDALAYTRWLSEEIRTYAAKKIETDVNNPLWLGLKNGALNVNLPNEAEWEKSARGTTGHLFPWGNEMDKERANTELTNIGNPSVVGCFSTGISPYGLLDISGNVWEWTRNVSLLRKENGSEITKEYNYPYDINDGREDINANSNSSRVLRGGSFYNDFGSARCAFRLRDAPIIRSRLYGFRVTISR